MVLLKRTIGYCILSLQVLLVFVLIFESRIELPPWLQAAGRAHPLVLHLPIGLLLVTALLIFTRKIFDGVRFDELVSLLLHITSLTASLTALMGVFLSREGGYAEGDLLNHKWLGVGLSFLCWIMLGLRKGSLAQKASASLAVVMLVFAAHFGASLTHGENFVLAPLRLDDPEPRIVTDSSTLFAAAVEPILENRCFSCHNPQKAKGKLVMTSLESLMRGGETGSLWIAGDPAHSLIVERLGLPQDHKEHMPPKDKAQLTTDELFFISAWIERGADTKIKLSEIAPEDTLTRLASSIISRYGEKIIGPKYTFAAASPGMIQQLNTPYRNVFQIALNEPALQVDFFLRGSFRAEFLQELMPVREQVVSINLTRMPVDDNDLEILSGFPHLEKIVLNDTRIEGPGLKYLGALASLRTVSLTGTGVDAQSLQSLALNGNVREVFVWNTKVREEDLRRLEKEFAHVDWEIGYQPPENEMLRLSAPFLRNDENVIGDASGIELGHRLPGTVIRYTLDGGDPDSLTSPVYDQPVQPGKYAVLKTKAYRDGWLSSDAKEYIVFRKGYRPERVELSTEPDPEYPGEGASTLIDEKKGMPDFYRAPVWMGFRNEPMEALFFFPGVEPPPVSHVTLSYARNIYAMCMPPASLEVWGGDTPGSMKLLGKTTPSQPTEWVGTRIEGATVEIPTSSFACYRIVARPLAKLPEFRDAAKEKGWLMVDEVFFN